MMGLLVDLSGCLIDEFVAIIFPSHEKFVRREILEKKMVGL